MGSLSSSTCANANSVVLRNAILDKKPDCHETSFFDFSLLQNQTDVPANFFWPEQEEADAYEDLVEPPVDLEGFLPGDEKATRQAAELLKAACLTHGYFQVINHGVDLGLVSAAYDHMETFFNLPLSDKVKARRPGDSMWGYSGAHADRFSSNLPWKETLSFPFHDNTTNPVVVDYFKSTLGESSEAAGILYQKYCGEMKQLALKISELLAISLGVERNHYRDFFEDGSCIMRCNSYPSCQVPGHTLGTGPHCDPTSLTILHQDLTGGLQVFANNKWKNVRPYHEAFVVNIGDTVMALSNGRYRSCLHRAMVNRYQERRSLAFFLCPREDKVVRPPEDIVRSDGTKLYPDFTWLDLLDFTQKQYRADAATFDCFVNLMLSSKSTLYVAHE